jgi:glucosylceramidase
MVVAAAAAAPASADPAHRGLAVTGTYSTAAQHWVSLPSTQDHGQAVDATVVVDPGAVRQRYEGMGFSLDETSVSNLWKLTPAQRDQAIRLLVSPQTGAGLNRFRLTIGSPDLIEHLPFWSEDDLPAGVTSDWDLRYFSIQRDLDLHIIDTIKLIQRYNPHATFFASAWSAPAWMKTNNQFLGEVALKPGSTTDYYQVGKLRDDCIDVLARYYAKFVQAYAQHGIRVDAVSLLNEPGIDVVYPAMDISVDQQQKLAVAMEKAFRAAHRNTGVYAHEFNFWDWHDPNSTATKNYYRIMNDPQVAKAIDAISFHPYWGDPTVMRDAYEQYGKPVEMTETSDLSPDTVLSYFRLDVGSYIMWAQTTDQNGGTLHWTPLRDNNVDWDQIAATTHWTDRLVTAHTDTGTFTVRDELYQFGQFARYLTTDDRRVESSAAQNGVSNVVYRDGHDNYVAVVGNDNDTPATVRIMGAGQTFVRTIPAHAFATLRWHADLPSIRHNHAPTLASVTAVTADQYSTVRVPLHATDADHDRLAFYATDLPAGASLDPTTGMLTLHPAKAGSQDIKVTVTDGKANASTIVHVMVAPAGAPIGQTIEAEAYVGENGWVDGGANFVESNAATSGGEDVGWTAPGNWLQYRVNVATAGTYDLELRVANGTGAVAANAVSFRDASGRTLATVSVPDTGGWGTYQSVHTPVALAAGDQLVTVYCESGGFNVDYLRLS